MTQSLSTSPKYIYEKGQRLKENTHAGRERRSEEPRPEREQGDGGRVGGGGGGGANSYHHKKAWFSLHN
jgi:hypothetical protein